MIQKIIDSGHDIAFHSYYHNPDWKPEIYKNEVETCRHVNNKIIGYRSPRSLWDDTTLHALCKNGFLWNAEYNTSPVLYFIHKGIVRLPIALDDWSIYTGDLKVEDWIDKFSELLGSRKYFGFGTHDFIFSKEPEKCLSAYE